MITRNYLNALQRQAFGWREVICLVPLILETTKKSSVVLKCVPNNSLHHSATLSAEPLIYTAPKQLTAW